MGCRHGRDGLRDRARRELALLGMGTCTMGLEGEHRLWDRVVNDVSAMDQAASLVADDRRRQTVFLITGIARGGGRWPGSVLPACRQRVWVSWTAAAAAPRQAGNWSHRHWNWHHHQKPSSRSRVRVQGSKERPARLLRPAVPGDAAARGPRRWGALAHRGHGQRHRGERDPPEAGGRHRHRNPALPAGFPHAGDPHRAGGSGPGGDAPAPSRVPAVPWSRLISALVLAATAEAMHMLLPSSWLHEGLEIALALAAIPLAQG